MPQTLLALAAALSFAYFALGRHQADHDVETKAIALEADLAAANVAQERMAEILLSYAWDEEDTNRNGVRVAPPASTLGPDHNGNGNETSPALYDDIDDFHGTARTRQAQAASGTLTFRDSVAVRYVHPTDPDGPAATSPTLAKRVEVFVAEVDARGRRGATVHLRRVTGSAEHAPHRR